MLTLSQFPLSRLALLRRVPFWAQALAVCALFAIAGVAALDDYGSHADEIIQGLIVADVADYALGVSEKPPSRQNRYYGMVFEMPLLLAERALGLRDYRHIYLMRHLIIHLFFIAGGFACGMLAYRTLGSRWVALFAMLMFLLHPRLYAHSFFNSKDVPFAAMLVIALYLIHRAFRKDTISVFLLCGVAVGLAINLRVFGLMLLPMILAMRALDLWQADRGERKHILTSAWIFTAAALATAYIIHPYYWENPLRFFEGIRVFSQHPTIINNLFMGEIYRSDAVPWNYIPVWFAITAPPVALALGAVGCAAVCRQAFTRPLASLRDRETRFRILLLGCFALPVAIVIALQANIYHGWRLMFFLWGPFCLLAAVGLCALAKSGAGEWTRGGVGARLPGWIRGGGMRRALAYGAAGFGLITTLTAMAALHPYEYVYFNALTDTKTPGALAKRYDMDYWLMASRQSLEYLLARYPDGALRVWPETLSLRILPQNDGDRIAKMYNMHAADFYLWPELGFYLRAANPQEAGFYHPLIKPLSIPDRQPIHSVRAYGSAIALIFAKDADAYLAAYEDVAANGDLLARSDFDIYAYAGALYYLSADCEPPAPRRAGLRFFLHITPVDPADLPEDRMEHGFENMDFWLDKDAAFFAGKCVNRQLLPEYPIARVATGVYPYMRGGVIWRADIDMAARAAAQALYNSIAAGDYGQPAAQSEFDLYINGNRLAYLKEPCAAGDAAARFFLHIFPANPADLSAGNRGRGFDNLDFQFTDHGAYINDKCVAERELPDYAIERIRTGQFVSGEGRVWGVEFSVGR